MPNFAAIGQTVAEKWQFFRFFKMAAASILHFQNVEILGVARLKTTKMRHRAKFRADRPNSCWDMVIFSIFQDGVRRHLRFWKCGNFRGGKARDGQNASLCQNFAAIGLTETWRFFYFSKMAAVRHLGFVMSAFGPPTKSIWWSLSLCKIWLESTQ